MSKLRSSGGPAWPSRAFLLTVRETSFPQFPQKKKEAKKKSDDYFDETTKFVSFSYCHAPNVQDMSALQWTPSVSARLQHAGITRHPDASSENGRRDDPAPLGFIRVHLCRRWCPFVFIRVKSRVRRLFVSTIARLGTRLSFLRLEAKGRMDYLFARGGTT